MGKFNCVSNWEKYLELLVWKRNKKKKPKRKEGTRQKRNYVFSFFAKDEKKILKKELLKEVKEIQH